MDGGELPAILGGERGILAGLPELGEEPAEEPVVCRVLHLHCSLWRVVFIKCQAEAYRWHLLITFSHQIDFYH